MKTADYDYDLPPELIAQRPIEPRDHSRLLVLDRGGRENEHQHFFDLPDLLAPGDLLVFNDSRVFPARLYGTHLPTGSRVELLLLSRLQPRTWIALVKPGRRFRVGAEFEVVDRSGRAGARGTVTKVESSGTRLVRFDKEPDLEEVGIVPLPPYIHEDLEDVERYQTVYAREEGSVAAPTAGLHFTDQLLTDLAGAGVLSTHVTLHVGWDSFRPVNVDDPAEHDMHSEFWSLTSRSAKAINRAKAEGRRVISVGTTAVRLLEHAARRCDYPAATVDPGSGWVDLFITPGFEFKVIDGMITNFHLPKSTLLMLVSAFAGRQKILDAYRSAMDAGYRFYSFGDAMLIR